MRFDRRSDSVNKFDRSTVEELATTVERIRGTPEVRGVLVTSGKDVFVVGADIFEFKALFELPESSIAAHIAHQNESFTSFEDLLVPTVVASNAIAFGGVDTAAAHLWLVYALDTGERGGPDPELVSTQLFSFKIED